ncbi:hypothetical protein B0H11DRAFT_2041882 [Mycena galericulata]|nr:hypothetical protein B0H11DRAFT_2041882 [Mycena galericulata]
MLVRPHLVPFPFLVTVLFYTGDPFLRALESRTQQRTMHKTAPSASCARQSDRELTSGNRRECHIQYVVKFFQHAEEGETR